MSTFWTISFGSDAFARLRSTGQKVRGSSPFGRAEQEPLNSGNAGQGFLSISVVLNWPPKAPTLVGVDVNSVSGWDWPSPLATTRDGVAGCASFAK
jgi:hypothetical protein